jgi:hypothetical protein
MQSSSIGVVYRVITSLTNMYHDTIKKHTPEYDPKVEIKVYRNVYGLVYGKLCIDTSSVLIQALH